MAIVTGFATLILFRRDLHTVRINCCYSIKERRRIWTGFFHFQITFFVGLLSNEVLNKVLKYAIQEPRPVSRPNMHNEFGMPSNHSQFMCFFATYVLLFVLLRLHQMNQNGSFMERFLRLFVIAVTWLAAALVCYGRVYLQYHTSLQVVVGSVIGICSGCLWFAFTQLILSPFYPKIVTWKVSEFFLLRDTTLIPNVLWFEYTVTRQEARARSRKMKPQWRWPYR